MYKHQKKLERYVFSVVILWVVINLRHLNTIPIILAAHTVLKECHLFYIVNEGVCIYNIFIYLNYFRKNFWFN